MHNVIGSISIALENYNAPLSTKVVYAIPGFLILENVFVHRSCITFMFNKFVRDLKYVFLFV